MTDSFDQAWTFQNIAALRQKAFEQTLEAVAGGWECRTQKISDALGNLLRDYQSLHALSLWSGGSL